MLYSETLYMGVDDLRNRDHIERDEMGYGDEKCKVKWS